jgi:hypothetical protein
MNTQIDYTLEQAEDHVRECEARVQRQGALVEELAAAGRGAEAAAARRRLGVLDTALDAAYRHLEIARRARRR